MEKTTQLISVTKQPGKFVSDKPEENKMERKELMRRSNRNFNIPPTPGKPRAFDYFLCPGSGEFDG